MFDWVDFLGKHAIQKNAEPWEPQREKCCRFICDYTAECGTVAIQGPEPPAGARSLLHTATSCEIVSTFCNRKCDHGVHPATDAKERKKKTLWGLKCHVNSWVQPLNTSGVLSTPFNAFKGQGFA